MVSASVEFITTRRAVKAAAVEIDAQQLIAHLQSRFGGQVRDVQKMLTGTGLPTSMWYSCMLYSQHAHAEQL